MIFRVRDCWKLLLPIQSTKYSILDCYFATVLMIAFNSRAMKLWSTSHFYCSDKNGTVLWIYLWYRIQGTAVSYVLLNNKCHYWNPVLVTAVYRNICRSHSTRGWVAWLHLLLFSCTTNTFQIPKHATKNVKLNALDLATYKYSHVPCSFRDFQI